MMSDDMVINKLVMRSSSNWFFQCSPEGEFVWHPDLIKAFVEQVKLEMQKTNECNGDKENGKK